MGVIKRGILGGFSKKIANVVGSSWKGIAVIKSLPLSVANPNSAAQQAQRGKFAFITALASYVLTTICKPYWDRFAQQMSGYNAFVQANIDVCSATEIVTPEDFIISKGTLDKAVGTGLEFSQATHSGQAGWTDNSGEGNALATDEVVGLLYNATTDIYVLGDVDVTRDASAITFDSVGFAVATNVLHSYIAFRRPDGSLVSDTLYQTANATA